jgi:hypothetical protein
LLLLVSQAKFFMLNDWSPSMRHPAIISILIFSLLLLQQGCTATPKPLEDVIVRPVGPKPRLLHVTEDMRAKISTIGIAVAEELPRVTLELPSKGAASGAGREAVKSAGNWVMAAERVASYGREFGITTAAAMLAVTPVVAAAGAVKGANEAPSAEAVESQEAQVRGVLQGEHLIHQLENQVLTHVTDRTDVVATILPMDAGDQASHRETVPASGVNQPDTMLRILLRSIDLRGTFDIDPPLELNVEAQVTLTVPAAAPPLYMHAFQYVTQARRLTEWTMDDAKSFHEAVDLSLARLAELIVDDLFLTHPFVHEHPEARLQTNYTR